MHLASVSTSSIPFNVVILSTGSLSDIVAEFSMLPKKDSSVVVPSNCPVRLVSPVPGMLEGLCSRPDDTLPSLGLPGAGSHLVSG